jgi:hypothetical protein
LSPYKNYFYGNGEGDTDYEIGLEYQIFETEVGIEAEEKGEETDEEGGAGGGEEEENGTPDVRITYPLRLVSVNCIFL